MITFDKDLPGSVEIPKLREALDEALRENKKLHLLLNAAETDVSDLCSLVFAYRCSHCSAVGMQGYECVACGADNSGCDDIDAMEPVAGKEACKHCLHGIVRKDGTCRRCGGAA